MSNLAKEFRELHAKTTQGCGDGSCRFKKPTGQHTNGGCRCFSNPDIKHFAVKAHNDLPKLLDELEYSKDVCYEGMNSMRETSLELNRYKAALEKCKEQRDYAINCSTNPDQALRHMVIGTNNLTLETILDGKGEG